MTKKRFILELSWPIAILAFLSAAGAFEEIDFFDVFTIFCFMLTLTFTVLNYVLQWKIERMNKLTEELEKDNYELQKDANVREIEHMMQMQALLIRAEKLGVDTFPPDDQNMIKEFRREVDRWLESE